jgi:hypothetical protein
MLGQRGAVGSQLALEDDRVLAHQDDDVLQVQLGPRPSGIGRHAFKPTLLF